MLVAMKKKYIYLLPYLGLFLFLILLKQRYLYLPLLGDESYYAAPFDWLSLGELTQNTFGHPPAWPLLLNITYSIFGYSSEIVHVFSLTISTLSMIYLYKQLSTEWSLTYSLLSLILLINHDYFLLASSIAHPVIASTLLGISSLIHLSRREYYKYAVCLCLAVLLRESALVFLLAALLSFRKKKVIFASFPSILILGIYYLIHFLVTKKVLLNSQMEYLMRIGEPILIFDFKHVIEFYIDHSFYSWYFGIALCLSILFIIYRRRTHNLLHDSLHLSLLVAGIGHSIFFSLYRHWAPRDTFMSSATLMILALSLLKSQFILGKNFSRGAAVLALLFVSRSILIVHDEAGELRVMQRDSLAFQRLGNAVLTIRNNRPDKTILAGIPIADYLNEPFMGYVSSSLDVARFGGWGGYDLKEDPQIFIFYNSYENEKYSKYVTSLIEKKSYKELYSEKLDSTRLIRVFEKIKKL